MNIRLTTLGGFRVVSDEREVDSVLGQPARAALLTFLAMEGHVSRDSLTTVFWPESDTERSRHALRQALYHLRGILGQAWIESRGHELRVSPDVHVDAHAFAAALERGDAETAARMYDGPFLEGLHLLDLAPWETWVDTRRAQLARDFRRACRAWVEERRGIGDFRGAVEAAERWVAPDPLDDEAQHALVRALAEAGERAEAIRQYEAYVRALEPEGLRPLDETRDLVEGLDRVSVEPSGLGVTHPSAPEPSVERGTERLRSGPASRRPLVGVAFVLTALLATGYLVSRPPTDSLVARGSIAEGERIILADFESTSADPALGEVVTDALRIDLVEAPILTPVEPVEIRSALDRMQVTDDRPLSAELAREVAVREGVKAVLGGDVSRAGTGYVLTATLRLAETGESLAGFRETAEAEEDLIPAIDRLSRTIRERAGESLSSVRATPPLERVTTSSLAALRLLSRADRVGDLGDYDQVIALLDEALELDPDFAMAWRRLAVALGNTEIDRVRELEAATRAYELRHLLTPRERYLAAARYHGQVTHDRDAMVHAYLRVLEIDPNDRVGLNNLGGEYFDRQDYVAAAELFDRAVEGPGASPVAFVNLVHARIALADGKGAGRVADAFAERYPDHQEVPFWRFWVLLLQDDEPAARSHLDPLVEDASLPPAVRARAHDHLARLALRRGRMSEARAHLEDAERIGQDVGPAFRLVRRLFRAHAEVAVGDPARGYQLLREAEGDRMFAELPPADRWHFLRAVVFAMGGWAEEAEEVLREFESDVPVEFHDQFRIRNESARALILLGRGEADAAIEVLEGIRTSRRCRACFAERMGWALRDADRLREAAAEWEDALAWQDFNHAIEWQFTQNLWIQQRLPPLYEALGDTTKALTHYDRLVDLWADADPELQSSVQRARERIAALTTP